MRVRRNYQNRIYLTNFLDKRNIFSNNLEMQQELLNTMCYICNERNGSCDAAVYKLDEMISCLSIEYRSEIVNIFKKYRNDAMIESAFP